MLNMVHIFARLISNLATTWLRQLPEEERWRQDPLSHPVLSRMTPHELSDLPFERC